MLLSGVCMCAIYMFYMHVIYINLLALLELWSYVLLCSLEEKAHHWSQAHTQNHAPASFHWKCMGMGMCMCMWNEGRVEGQRERGREGEWERGREKGRKREGGMERKKYKGKSKQKMVTSVFLFQEGRAKLVLVCSYPPVKSVTHHTYAPHT